jgi:hypothetical protein
VATLYRKGDGQPAIHRYIGHEHRRDAQGVQALVPQVADRRDGGVGQGLSRTLEPAYVAFDGKGSDEFLFGCVIAGLGCDAAADSVDFIWSGHDEWTRPAATAGLNSWRTAR